MDPLEAFVARFSEFWANPRPERMGELLSTDVLLKQPLSAPLQGLAAVEAEFRKILGWLPDLRGDVERWNGAGDTLFIEFRLRATLAGRAYGWPVVDRFTLRGDKAIERVSYFDSLPLVLRILRHPRAWRAWWRSGTARPWS